LKIVDITEFYSERGGGIRSHLTDRASYLSRHDHRHLVIAPGPRDEVTCVGDSSPGRGGSRIMRLAGPPQPYDRTYHLLHRFRRIRQRVRDERPDVLEAHSPYLAAAAVVASGRGAARLKTAFWHSDHLGVYVESLLTRHLGSQCALGAVRPLRRGIRALLAPFDATFAAGREQADRLRAAGVPRVIHIPFGVDKQTFRPDARSEAWRRASLGDSDADAGTPLLVGAGRFAREKRWDVVLDAFARVSARRRARLVLFGDGPERGRLERSAPPGVRFPGFVRDRAGFAMALASADVLVHAAPYETFGLSLAEAVACGLPIVVPDAGGAAEHAAPGCSEKYSSLDVAACASSIEALLDRPRDDLRARALEAAARAASRDDHFRQVLSAYDQLLHELGR
jgi:alpha-1,6-mannosyltransferase